MKLSGRAEQIYNKLNGQTKLGDLRIIAKEIKKDHQLALELWSSDKLYAKHLSILIMDNKALTTEFVQSLLNDIARLDYDDRIQLADWLMANQLSKNKKTVALLESWEHNPSSIQRRLFWYYQGRLRWVGQTPPDNTKDLLSSIEERILKEDPEVQWAMNFTAAWIGIFDKSYRDQCIQMGKNFGLYKDEIVAKGCHPEYLPEFIKLEVKKRKL